VIADPLAGLVLAGFEGTEASAPGVRALIDLGVGGFIVFGRNVESPQQVHALLKGIREAVGDRPVFFAVDQEGGRVARLRAPLTVWPPLADLGATADATQAEAMGAALASEIGALGFNLVFAPVLDVSFSGTTSAIGDRSLGSVPAEVGRLGAALVRGIQGAGLMACGKHFPGHGHVTVDSHLALPICTLSSDELRSDHLAPFVTASAAGLGSVMTAHVRYPAVDSAEPATFSRTWLHDILRTEIGFSGLVLTDDLEMGAVTSPEAGSADSTLDRTARIAGAAVRSLRAGADGLLICKDLPAIRASVAALRSSADDDPSFLTTCLASLARLQEAAANYPARPATKEGLSDHLGVAAHLSLADAIGAGVGASSDGSAESVDPTEGHTGA
jgi:beta-N-acetylhexosaminidase